MQINHYDSIADLYDIYVPVTFDIDFFIEETKKTSGEVLELMSGTGRVSLPLLEAGIKLTCVDLSAASNVVLEEKLRQKGLKADVYTQDVCELNLPQQFDMIIIPFNSFTHITSLENQRRALARIKQHLLPGGTFLCTFGNPNTRQEAIDGQLKLFRKYPLPDTNGTLLLWIVENHTDEDDRVVDAMQFYEEYDANGVLKRKRLLELHFRLSSKEEFEQLAKEAGFRVKALYGDYAHSEYSAASPFEIWLLENVG